MVTAASDSALFLALDTASPVVSVAIACEARLLVVRSIEIRRSSEHLIAMVDEVLAEAGCRLQELAGIVALRGPGSFTGLRVGLATVLGLHQAIAVRATALPTHRVLAQSVESSGRTVAAVDAQRDEWFVQEFGGSPEPLALGAVHRLTSAALARLETDVLVGFGLQGLGLASDSGRLIVEPGPLAVTAALMAPSWSDWDAQALTAPLYLRSAAVTTP